jgi:hypothetical protein
MLVRSAITCSLKALCISGRLSVTTNVFACCSTLMYCCEAQESYGYMGQCNSSLVCKTRASHTLLLMVDSEATRIADVGMQRKPYVNVMLYSYQYHKAVTNYHHHHHHHSSSTSSSSSCIQTNAKRPIDEQARAWQRVGWIGWIGCTTKKEQENVWFLDPTLALSRATHTQRNTILLPPALNHHPLTTLLLYHRHMPILIVTDRLPTGGPVLAPQESVIHVEDNVSLSLSRFATYNNSTSMTAMVESYAANTLNRLGTRHTGTNVSRHQQRREQWQWHVVCDIESSGVAATASQWLCIRFLLHRHSRHIA